MGTNVIWNGIRRIHGCNWTYKYLFPRFTHKSRMLMSDYKAHQMDTYGEEGSGYYSNHSKGHATATELATPMIMKCLKDIKVKPNEPFVICEYGAADGGISMKLMKLVIDTIMKQHGQDKEIHIIYEEQETHDFKSLFSRIHGFLPGDEKSYYGQHKNVFVSVTGTNFYQQCIPSNTVHLGLSFSAMQFLSQIPTNFKDSIIHSFDVAPNELSKFAEQGAKDWEAILLHRSKELKSGGRLVIANFCIDELGQCTGLTNRVKKALIKTANEIWSQMSKEGKITEEEYIATTFPFYARTRQEHCAPFEDPNSRVTKSGLKLLSIEDKISSCVHHKRWLLSGKSKDDKAEAMQHSKQFMLTIRIWGFLFRRSLTDKHTEEEKDKIIEELFERLENSIASDPEEYAFDLVHDYLVIEKQ